MNLLLLTVGGPSGRPPIYGRSSEAADTTADPLAQGMILTAIVITFGVSAFMLALIYRSWRLSRQGEEDAVRVEEQEMGLAEAEGFTTEEVTDMGLAQTQEFEEPEQAREEER